MALLLKGRSAMALCVSVQVHPTLPSHNKSFGHTPDGDSNRLSGAFPGIPGASVCSLGSWLSAGAPAPTTGRLIFCSLSYTLFSVFFYFRTHLFLDHVPPFLCPDSQVTALYYFLLITLNCFVLNQTSHLCYIGSLISQLYLT